MFRLPVKGKDKSKVIEEKRGRGWRRRSYYENERGGGDEKCNNRIGKSAEENGRN